MTVPLKKSKKFSNHNKAGQETRSTTNNNAENNNTNNVPEYRYSSFKLEHDNLQIPRISLSQLNKESLWNQCVSLRKPCVISGVISGFDTSLFDIDNLTKTLNFDGDLQVEKKVKGGFGSGENRLKMKLDELVEKLRGGDDSLYLTTQYAEDEVEEKRMEVDEQDDDDDDDEDEEEETTFGNNDLASDNDSIDMDNLVDDFDEIEDDFEEDNCNEQDNDNFSDGDDEEEIIDRSCRTGPLTKTEAELRVKELLQKPLTNLLNNEIPIQPELLEELIPQQINLWMGLTSVKKDPVIDLQDKETLGIGKWVPGSQGCSSSGLHHDHADNLYIPIMGSKRFTLFSPENVTKLYTVGTVNELFDSGVIDYTRDEKSPHWKHINADGSIASEVARWRLENDADSLSKTEKKRLERLIEQEESFDNVEQATEGEVKHDPPSFSRIPPCLLHLDEIEDQQLKSQLLELLQHQYPSLQSCLSTTIHLEPGDMLYLPAGWFHEVTSYGNETSHQIHMAMNYWFAPPDSDKLSQVYKSDYWKDDYERTLRSLDYIRTIKG